MKTENIRKLTGYFNKSIDGAWVPCNIKKSEIKRIVGNDLAPLITYLERWKREGNIEIIGNLLETNDDDYCLTLIKSRPTWEV